jgi:hypothetical protein
MTNSLWVTLHNLWKAVLSHISLSNFSLWVTLHILSKSVMLITSSMINSKWVTLHILWMAFSSHLFLLPTASKWHLEKLSHYIFSYDQQVVSDIAHFVEGSLMRSTASEWYCSERQSHDIFSYDQKQVSDNAHLWKAVTWHHFLPDLLIACEW